MKTLMVKINERKSMGRAIMELLRSTAMESDAVKILEEEKSPYSPDFVKMVKKSQSQIKQGKYKVINPDDVWGSLGL